MCIFFLPKTLTVGLLQWTKKSKKQANAGVFSKTIVYIVLTCELGLRFSGKAIVEATAETMETEADSKSKV